MGERTTQVAEELRELADRLEVEGEWPSPWDWSSPHKHMHHVRGADYELGVDNGGRVLINHDGYVKCVVPGNLRPVLEEAERHR